MDLTVLGIAFDIEDGLFELGVHGVDGFEGVVLEDFLADFIPEIFLRVELCRLGRQEEQRAQGARSPQRWLGAPSRTRRMCWLANFRARTLRKAWNKARHILC